jgi:flagellar hook-basal body complex protein FliE
VEYLMQKIGDNNQENSGLLLNSMRSDAAMRKLDAKAQEAESTGSLGNILQSFGDVLKDQVAKISDLQAKADEAAQTYATGGDIELHNVILASEKAGLSLELAMQVRNKVVAAYQEVMHMNI